MKELRRASLKDVKKGQILYYRRRKEEGGSYSREVKGLVDPRDAKLGYVATNGHRYSLENAYVKVTSPWDSI